MSYEEERPQDRLDLGGHQARKKRQQQQESNIPNWRLDSSNKMSDMDAVFKLALGKSVSIGNNYYQPTYYKTNVRTYPEIDNKSPTKSKKGRLLHRHDDK